MSSSEQQRSARAGFKQEMHTRHIVMLALGGVIGTGLLMQFFLFGMWAVLYTYTPELYPTSARATGAGFASAIGRVGSLLGPLVTGLVFPITGQGGVFALGALCFAIAAGVALFKYQRSVMQVLAACALLGLALSAVRAL